ILKKWNNSKQIKQLCILWATEAKALKLAFSTVMTESIYQELQESLTKENNLLLQALRHIVDGWIDSQFNNTAALSKLALDPHISSIFSNWYAIENVVLYLEDKDKNNGK
ncbi:1725_t:CDS:2, partial [Dentiscutata erythropus]